MKEINQLKDYDGVINHYKKEYGKNIERNAKMHKKKKKILCGTNRRLGIVKK